MKNKEIKKAVAIKYSKEQYAPNVVAKGKGELAKKIIEKADDIPLVENAELVEELDKIEIGEYIPPELYEVVAQILVFVSEMDRNSDKKWL